VAAFEHRYAVNVVVSTAKHLIDDLFNKHKQPPTTTNNHQQPPTRTEQTATRATDERSTSS
jgi:hypothetical protein